MKYDIWYKEDGVWVSLGEGPYTEKQADRIIRELRRECGGTYKRTPWGVRFTHVLLQPETNDPAK